MSHECYECRWEGQDHPCRVDGVPDPDLIARHYVGHMDEVGAMPDGDLPWSWVCWAQATQDDPDLSWRIALACLPLLRTEGQACVFAAGHLENLIHHHGEAFIARIEGAARVSARFRYVLSGVWPQGRPKTDEVWQRLEAARTPGPWIDDGAALPPD